MFFLTPAHMTLNSYDNSQNDNDSLHISLLEMKNIICKEEQRNNQQKTSQSQVKPKCNYLNTRHYNQCL